MQNKLVMRLELKQDLQECIAQKMMKSIDYPQSVQWSETGVVSSEDQPVGGFDFHTMLNNKPQTTEEDTENECR